VAAYSGVKACYERFAERVSGLLTADYFAEAHEIAEILVTPDLGSSGVVGRAVDR